MISSRKHIENIIEIFLSINFLDFWQITILILWNFWNLSSRFGIILICLFISNSLNFQNLQILNQVYLYIVSLKSNII